MMTDPKKTGSIGKQPQQYSPWYRTAVVVVAVVVVVVVVIALIVV